MVSHGAPPRSMLAIADPSSTADALPTPCSRSAQPDTSAASLPGQFVGAAQAGEVTLQLVARAAAAQLEQRAVQPAQVALAPAGGRDAHAPAVEIDHPATAIAVEQQVVGVEVGMVQAFAVETRDQAPGLLPRCTAAGHQCAVGQ